MCYDPCSLVVVAPTHVIVTCTLVYIRVVTTIKCLTVASCSRHNNGDQDAEWIEEELLMEEDPQDHVHGRRMAVPSQRRRLIWVKTDPSDGCVVGAYPDGPG